MRSDFALVLTAALLLDAFWKNNGAHASEGPCQAGFSQSFYSLLVSKDVLKGGGVRKGEDETEAMEAPRRRGCLVIANCVLNFPLSSQVQHTGEPSSLKKEAMLKHRGRNKKREEEQGRQTDCSVN
ncbi:unnamed protein product [Tetraodon nigroviridis]|uniref:(spotted green pufferfish) hypothetical protein n=1 Tax=Tetraodon nigroviridis TaxID=99883 RepID=Q4S5K5_TETNG|nr:unnamed protein product [Tetraodon nigroviridis]